MAVRKIIIGDQMVIVLYDNLGCICKTGMVLFVFGVRDHLIDVFVLVLGMVYTIRN